jgi:hypothetical protein
MHFWIRAAHCNSELTFLGQLLWANATSAVSPGALCLVSEFTHHTLESMTTLGRAVQLMQLGGNHPLVITSWPGLGAVAHTRNLTYKGDCR